MQMRKRATRRKTNAEDEAKLQEASDALTNGMFTKISTAAAHFEVDYHTLRRRHKGLNQPYSKAHKHEQLLTVAKEKTMCKWIKYMGATGHPFSKEALHVKVSEISTILLHKKQSTGK